MCETIHCKIKECRRHMNGKTMCQRKENVQEALQERKSVILPPVSTNEAYVDPRVILPPVSTNEISRINRALQAARFKRTAWIEGRAEINYQKAPFWYFTCSNCHEPTDYTGILDINCHYCRVKINPSPRAFIALTILDATGKMDTLALGEEAEKLMSIQATELTEINNQNMILLHHITQAIQGKRLLCFVKKATPREKAIKGTAFTIVTSYEVEQLATEQQTSLNFHNDYA
ncbi:uncharacterized protein [Coffea arabica]|uniref:Uncharacterized protein isoform X3 n=1 Tax=Coffea arabica TaxID=13443 RepID=A0A6P6TC50_COFAR|nr:uncharacterized protein LOC113699244 isoform X3 [Coffea arabica]